MVILVFMLAIEAIISIVQTLHVSIGSLTLYKTKIPFSDLSSFIYYNFHLVNWLIISILVSIQIQWWYWVTIASFK